MFTDKLAALLVLIKGMSDLLRNQPVEIVLQYDKLSRTLLENFLKDNPEGVQGYTLTESEKMIAKDSYRKIECIKAVRARTLLGLKEAKDLVENWQKANNIQPRSF